MKEKELELTRQADSPKLEGEGEVFMAEATAEQVAGQANTPELRVEPEGLKTTELAHKKRSKRRKPEEPHEFFDDHEYLNKTTPVDSEIALALWKIHKKEGEDLTPEEEALARMGILPMKGGAENSRRKEKSARDEIQDIAYRIVNINEPIEYDTLEGKRTLSAQDQIKIVVEQEIVPRVRLLEARGLITAEEIEEYNTILQEIRGKENLDEIKQEATELLGNIEKYFSSEVIRETEIPRSLEDLLELIMQSEGKDWQEDGPKALIKDGEAQLDNYQEWIREKMLFYHRFNPTGEIDLFASISVPTLYRSISFSEMVYFARYFRKRGERQIAIESGREIARYSSEQNETYDKLKNDLIMEVFMFNMSRNYNIKYWEVRGEDQKLPGVMMGIHQNGVFTRGKNMETLYTLPASALETLDTQKNYLLGNAIRRADLAYYHLADIEALKAVLGRDSVMFKRDYEYIDPETWEIRDVPDLDENGVQKKDQNGRLLFKKAPRKAGAGVGWSEDWFDGDGNLLAAHEEDFNRYINIFSNVHADPNVVAEVRERIRQSLAVHIARQAIVIRERDLHRELSDEEKRQILKKAQADAAFAEEFSFTKTRWTGTNARNDKEGVSFDAGTKFENTMRYRKRQVFSRRGEKHATRRLGLIGNIYNVQGFKRLATDFYTGIEIKPYRHKVIRDGRETFVEEKETLLEKLQGGTTRPTEGGVHSGTIEYLLLHPEVLDERIDTEATEDKLEFLDETSRQWLANQYLSAAGLFEGLVERHEMDLDKIVTFDRDLGRLIVADQKKFNELIDGIGKKLRYAFSTYSQLKYDALVRDNLTGKTVPMAFYLFDDEVIVDNEQEARLLKSLRERGDEEGLLAKQMEIAKRLQDNRGDLWVKPLKYLIATEIWSHRDLASPYQRYDMATVEKIYYFLENLPGEIGYEEGNFKKTKVKRTFFTKEELDWIRKKSKTETSRMFREEFALAAVRGTFEGFWKGFKIFFRDMTKEFK